MMDIQTLQKTLGVNFSDEELLHLAFTHRSSSKNENNQRLEFLGDAILGSIIADTLFKKFPSESEGALAKRQAALVSGKFLSALARELKINEFIIMSSSEEKSGGRENDSILEDVIEALIGAIYLDAGFDAAYNFVQNNWAAKIDSYKAPPKDSKSELQEWAQGEGLALPVYEVIETSGADHAPEFTVQVCVDGFEKVTAKAASKKLAQSLAAQKLLEIIHAK